MKFAHSKDSDELNIFTNLPIKPLPFPNFVRVNSKMFTVEEIINIDNFIFHLYLTTDTTNLGRMNEYLFIFCMDGTMDKNNHSKGDGYCHKIVIMMCMCLRNYE